MENYLYKQNTGVLSDKQGIIVKATTNFVIKSILENKLVSTIRYSYYKCNDCHRLKVYFSEDLKNQKLILIPSTSDYQMWIYINEEYVYKDRGKVFIDLGGVNKKVLIIDFKMKSKNSINLVLENGNYNKLIMLK